MKKILFAVAFLCLSTAIFAQQKDSTYVPKGDVWKKFNASKEGISIEYPDNWELTENDLGARIFLKAPLRGEGLVYGETIFLQINALSRGTDTLSLDILTDGFDKNAKDYNTDCQIERFSNLDFFGTTAKELIFTASAASLRYRSTTYYFIKNKKMYVLTFNADAKNFADIKPIADKIIRSFKVR